MRQAFWTRPVAAAVLALAGGTPRGRGTDRSCRVGVVLPLSGQFALGGQNAKRGYDLAVEELNAAGGVKALGGAPIELVYADNQGKQDVAIGETERLIQQEKVSAIMGSWHSPTTIAGTQAAERNKTPWMVEVASADIVVERGFKYVSRVNVKAQLVRRGAGRFSGLRQGEARPEDRARRHHVYGRRLGPLPRSPRAPRRR